MQPVVLITGTSSGIGRAAVQRFSETGWRVAATLRSPERETELGRLPGVSCFRLDVASEPSVRDAFAQILEAHGRIDVVVNNAGFGSIGVHEHTGDETLRRQFETNVFGVMRVTREAIPIFRRQGGGTVVQISSMAGRVAFPGYSLYVASKWAVEGFSESLAYELRPFNIRVRLVEPGNVKTGFYAVETAPNPAGDPSEYREFLSRCREVAAVAGASGDTASCIAETVFRAAVDSGWRLRYPVGRNSRLLILLSRVLPTSVYAVILRRQYRIL
ncbi:MAG: SDR family oxidoreductase [Verrucomicrobiota bacterium]